MRATTLALMAVIMSAMITGAIALRPLTFAERSRTIDGQDIFNPATYAVGLRK